MNKTSRSFSIVRILRGAVTIALAATAAALIPTQARAELIIDFFDNFGGATPTGTSNPLLTAIIRNVTGGAEIQLESFLEPPSNTEYIEQISLYLSNPLPQEINSFTLGANCSINAGSFSCANSNFKTGTNLNQPDFNPTIPADAINAALNLPTSGGTGGLVRFDANDKGTFFIAGLTEQMLLTFIAIDNNGVNQTLYAGAKINSIDCAGGTGACSTSIGGSLRKVPAPLPILGATAAFGFSRRLRRRLNNSDVTA